MTIAIESGPTQKLRRILLAIVAATMVGLTIELLLLGHTESKIQWIPLIGFVVGMAAVAVVALSRSSKAIRLFQLVMLGFLMVGCAGLYFHFKGNIEFALETYPEMKGRALVWEAMTGATPTLAPGAMIQLALVGMAYTYRHPRLARTSTESIIGETT